MFEILCAIALVIGLTSLAQDLSTQEVEQPGRHDVTYVQQPWENQ